MLSYLPMNLGLVNNQSDDGWKFQLLQVIPVMDLRTRGYCALPYPGHPKGCPNFRIRYNCPPNAPLFHIAFDMQSKVYAVVNEFDLKSHVEKMRTSNPTWSERQLRNLLYWQNSARKRLEIKVEYFLRYTGDVVPTLIQEGYAATYIPEAMGVNVTETMKRAGIILEWPPINIARQIAFLAKRK